MSVNKSTKVKFNNFILELNPSPAEFSFVYRCIHQTPPKKENFIVDRWMLRSLDGHGFGYILAANDYDIGELEIFDVGIYNRFKMMPAIKALKTLVSGRVYNNDATVSAFTKGYQQWYMEHLLKKVGFYQFDPEEPWVTGPANYYIHDINNPE